jgi:hypothetical protein
MGRTPGRMCIKVARGCPDNPRVIAEVTDADVAARAQQAPDALPTGDLSRRTAAVVMVDVPDALAAGLIAPADSALAVLRFEHFGEGLDRQPVTAQVEHARVGRVLRYPVFGACCFILRTARAAIGRGQARELCCSLVQVTARARAREFCGCSAGLAGFLAISEMPLVGSDSPAWRRRDEKRHVLTAQSCPVTLRSRHDLACDFSHRQTLHRDSDKTRIGQSVRKGNK